MNPISSTLKSLRALSDPTRLRIVALLEKDELSVNELQEITRMGQSRISTHLGLLLDVSESMGDDIAFTKTAAIKFLNTLLEAVDITFVDFDTEVRATRYEQSDFARVIERIRLQKARGWTRRTRPGAPL